MPYRRGGVLAGKTAFSFVGKRGGFTLRLVLACPAGATAQPLAAGCLLAAMPLRDSSCPAGASPPYGWGVFLAEKTTFSFAGKVGCFYLAVGFLPARLGPQPSRWRLRRLTDGAYPLRVKPLFLLLAKEKAVLDSEKEKVDQWKSWGGALQQDKVPTLLGYPLGKVL